MTDELCKAGVILSPGQALKIMAISVMLKDGDLSIRGEDDDAGLAIEALRDAGEEIAIQMHGYAAEQKP